MPRPPRRRRDYRTRLKVQALEVSSTTPTARGHPQKAWTTKTTIWAYKAQLSGREGQFAREIQPTATHEVETDASTYLSVRRRLVVAESTGDVLHIEAIDDLESRGRTVRLLCAQRVTST